MSDETKAALRAAADRHHLTESALIKRVLETMLVAAAPAVGQNPDRVERPARRARLYVRLTTGDLALLRERATTRCQTPATYASTLIRAHLRGLMSVPDEELRAIRCSSNELAAVGRNLNQIARVTLAGGHGAGPSREELRTVIRICETLRDSIRSFVSANRSSWESGDAASNG